jgi:hypothetical protein
MLGPALEPAPRITWPCPKRSKPRSTFSPQRTTSPTAIWRRRCCCRSSSAGRFSWKARPETGKTEIAKTLAAALGRRLIRLQCYEGLDASSAVYEWNFAAQMIAIRTGRSDR